MTERTTRLPQSIGTTEIAALQGYSQRHICALAASGKTPSAFRVTDTSEWRFDRERVLAWIGELKAQTQQRASWNGGESLEHGTTREEYERVMGYGGTEADNGDKHGKSSIQICVSWSFGR